LSIDSQAESSFILQDHVNFRIVAKARPSSSCQNLFDYPSALQAAQVGFAGSGIGPLSAHVGWSIGFEEIDGKDH